MRRMWPTSSSSEQGPCGPRFLASGRCSMGMLSWWRGSRPSSGANPRGGRRGPGRTSAPSMERWPTLLLPPPEDKRVVAPAALKQQLIVPGQLADLGPQSGDLLVAVIGRPALQGGLSAGREVIAPTGEGGGGDAQFAGEQFQALAAEEAEDGVALPRGREAAALAGIQGVGHGCGLLGWTLLMSQSDVQRNPGAEEIPLGL